MIIHTPVALVTAVNVCCTSPVNVTPASAATVVEDDGVKSEIPMWTDAFTLLFGLTRCIWTAQGNLFTL